MGYGLMLHANSCQSTNYRLNSSTLVLLMLTDAGFGLCVWSLHNQEGRVVTFPLVESSELQIIHGQNVSPQRREVGCLSPVPAVTI